jgi:site-specific DNA-cytosine methylase
MTAKVMRQQDTKVRQHIDCELDQTARAIANLHHNTDTTSLPQDIKLIRKHHIDLIFKKYGTVDLVVIGTPCQDLSCANSAGKGLKGKESVLIIQALDVLDMIKELNPKVKYLIENVRFKEKHPKAYEYFCQRIGHEPIVTDANDMSCANRKRYFWTNTPQSDHPQQPVPANQFIEGNAKLVNNRITAPCAMASWRCEQCNNRHEPYCNDSHSHAHHHYIYTRNPIRIQESGSYHG